MNMWCMSEMGELFGVGGKEFDGGVRGVGAGMGTEGGGSSNGCVSFCGLHVMAQDRDLLG